MQDSAHRKRDFGSVMLKKFDESIAAFDKAISLAPKMPGLYTNRARVYALKEDFEKAMKDLGEALSIDRNDIGALLLRARVYQVQQKFDDAMEDVNRLLRVRPGLIAGIELRAGLHAGRADRINRLLLRRDGDDKRRHAGQYEEHVSFHNLLRLMRRNPRSGVAEFQHLNACRW